MATGGQSGGDERPLVIVKRYKKVEGGHHGGAWKIAYADFVTAMMAFFLVMWLVTSISKQERAAIFEYFKNPSMENGKSVHPAPGQMVGPGGASSSPINLGGGMDAPRTSLTGTPTQLGVGAQAAPPPMPQSAPQPVPQPVPQTASQAAGAGAAADTSLRQGGQPISPQATENKRLEALLKELQEAIAKGQALKPFKDQLLIDIMPEGLRIQIVDSQNRAMFDVGRANLKDYTVSILKSLAPYLASVPNRISITGHTDATPYPGSHDYTNWELSADRANAARRVLVSAGLPANKIGRIVGLADSAPIDRANPVSPVNRRISIIVMTHEMDSTPEGLARKSL